VEKALQHNQQPEGAPMQQHHTHEDKGKEAGGAGGGVGTLVEAAQLQQERQTVAALQADLAQAQAQLAELTKFLQVCTAHC